MLFAEFLDVFFYGCEFFFEFFLVVFEFLDSLFFGHHFSGSVVVAVSAATTVSAHVLCFTSISTRQIVSKVKYLNYQVYSNIVTIFNESGHHVRKS